MINWSNTHTDKERYEKVGILDDMTKYFTYEKIVSPTIIDACCSNGMAIQYSVNKLKNELGITPFVIGIDISKDVKKYAEKNVDEFINSDILNVDNKKSSADIVICHKAAIYIHGDQRSKIIQKCSTFLKKDGLLITDADDFLLSTFKISEFMNSSTFFSAYFLTSFDISIPITNGVIPNSFFNLFTEYCIAIPFEQHASIIVGDTIFSYVKYLVISSKIPTFSYLSLSVCVLDQLITYILN